MEIKQTERHEISKTAAHFETTDVKMGNLIVVESLKTHLVSLEVVLSEMSKIRNSLDKRRVKLTFAKILKGRSSNNRRKMEKIYFYLMCTYQFESFQSLTYGLL